MKIAVFYDHITEAVSQTGKSLSTVLQEVRACGIEAVDINLSQLLEQEEKILAELATAGLKISCIYETYDFGDPAALDQAYAQVDAARRVGAGRILVVPGFVSEADACEFPAVQRDYEKMATCLKKNSQVAGMVQALRNIVAYATPKKVAVTLEDYDLKTAPYATTNGLRYFMEAVPGLRFTVDCGNFAYSDEDAWEGYQALKAYVVHCHCKDRKADVCDTGLQYNKGLWPSPCGSGYMPIARIVRDLQERGYEGYFAIEHFGAEKQLDYMKQSAAYLLSLQNRTF